MHMESLSTINKSVILVGKGNGGRLGDAILIYCKAKYLSYKFDIPLLCTRLPLFDQFSLSLYENMCHHIDGNMFEAREKILDCHTIPLFQQGAIAFDIDFYCQMRKMTDKFRAYVGCAEYPFDWFKKKMVKYPDFGKELKRNLQLRDQNSRQEPVAKGAITVAVATRMGSGPDDELIAEQFFNSDSVIYRNEKYHPFKFVPQQFYIDQVKRLSALLQHRTMQIYFFVDKNKEYTEKILVEWRKALYDYKNISIQCDMETNWQKRMLDDLYTMAHCDCLVRGCSHFAGIAQLAGDHKIIIGPDPISYIWSGNKLIFKRAFIYFQNSKENKFEQYVYEDTAHELLQSLAKDVFKTEP